MAAHAEFSPSAMKRIIACPGSVELCKKAPPQPPSPYAEEGTQAHNLAEAMLLMEDTLPEHTQEMLDAVQVYVDYCDPIIDSADKYGIEARLKLSDELFGTSDCYALLGRTLYVIDYKHGQGVTVAAEENPQALTYAGLVLADPSTNIEPDDVDSIILTIVQPRGMGPAVDSWGTDVRRVQDHMAEVAQAMEQAKSENPSIEIGDHCRFCSAKMICPAMEKAQSAVAEWNASDLEPDKIADLLTAASAVEQRIKDIYQYAQHRLEQGEQVPGWKLVAKRASRKWVDEGKVHRWARKHGKLKTMYKKTLLSPAQTAKVMSDEYESLTHLVDSVSTGMTVAPEADKREAVESPFAGLAALGKRSK